MIGSTNQRAAFAGLTNKKRVSNKLPFLRDLLFSMRRVFSIFKGGLVYCFKIVADKKGGSIFLKIEFAQTVTLVLKIDTSAPAEDSLAAARHSVCPHTLRLRGGTQTSDRSRGGRGRWPREQIITTK